jgi:hypothetical protein
VLFAVLAVLMPLVHFAFVVVLVGGALILLWRPQWWRFHLPAVAAMAAVSATGSDCPLTVLETHFRQRAGWSTYDTGFISHYLVEPWHPAGITPIIRAAIVAVWVVPNALAYATVLRWRRRPQAVQL